MRIRIGLLLALGSVTAVMEAAETDAPLAHAEALWREGAESLDEKPLMQAAGILAPMAETAGARLLLARIWAALWTCRERAGGAAGIAEACAQAVAHAEQAVRLDPEGASAHAVLGDLYGRSISLRKPVEAMTYGPKAEQEIRKALAIDPGNADAHLALGRNRLFAPPGFGGSPAAALESFRKAVAASPASAEAWCWVGEACRALGKANEARDAWRKALEANPRWRAAREALEASGK